jgi:hypothetical protein
MDVRPLTQTRRTVFLRARVTPEERERFMTLCGARRIDASTGLRRLVREAAAFGPSLDGESRAAIVGLTAQLKAVGVNLNQVVRAMNTGLVPSSDAILTSVQACAEQIKRAEAMFVSICEPRFQTAVAALSEGGDDAK